MKQLSTRRRVFLPVLAAVFALLGSCVSTKDITYFRPATKSVDKMVMEIEQAYVARIAPGDILSINITSLNPDAVAVFNPLQSMETMAVSPQQVGTIAPQRIVGYTVDEEGNIELPMIGKIAAGGKTSRELETALQSELERYVESPTVLVSILSFKISVLGEVTRPAVYTIGNEKITLLEALALAGDITPYGKKNSVMIIREQDGQREFARLDMTSMEVFTSPYYYLHSGDIVYVQPMSGRATSADRFVQLAPLGVSMITLIVLILTNVL